MYEAYADTYYVVWDFDAMIAVALAVPMLLSAPAALLPLAAPAPLLLAIAAKLA